MVDQFNRAAREATQDVVFARIADALERTADYLESLVAEGEVRNKLHAEGIKLQKDARDVAWEEIAANRDRWEKLNKLAEATTSEDQPNPDRGTTYDMRTPEPPRVDRNAVERYAAAEDAERVGHIIDRIGQAVPAPGFEEAVDTRYIQAATTDELERARRNVLYERRQAMTSAPLDREVTTRQIVAELRNMGVRPSGERGS